MSQEQVALAAGLDRTYVSGIERSRRNPSLQSMQRIAAVLNIDLADVLLEARELANRLEGRQPIAQGASTI